MSDPSRQIDAFLQTGKRLHGAGRLAEAGQVYRQVLAVAPDHPEALHMMGVLYLQIGQAGQAVAWIERAIGASDAAAHAMEAGVTELRDRASGAGAARASGSQSGGMRARGAPTGGTGVRGASARGTSGLANAALSAIHVHHAHALLALGRAGEAVRACRIALQLRRGNAEAHQALGHALTDSGDYPGALQAYQEAARLKPDLPDLLNNLGTALHHANRLEEAARTLTRAHGRDPRDPGILVNLVQRAARSRPVRPGRGAAGGGGPPGAGRSAGTLQSGVAHAAAGAVRSRLAGLGRPVSRRRRARPGADAGPGGAASRWRGEPC